MKRVNWKKFAIVVLIVIVVAFATGVVVWMQRTMEPSDTALNALRSDDRVKVTQESGLITFEAVGIPSNTGYVFYPGAGVDYRSYAPALRQIAQDGHFVVLAYMPLNLAFFNANAAGKVISKYPEIDHWAIGGHSLGGVVAANYAVQHNDIAGVVFWASYPADNALKQMETKVISIYGTNDGLATEDKIDESRVLLSTDTVFVAIEGGNHAQFGDYGPQPGDNAATISRADQQAQVTQATSDFLKELGK